MKISVVTNAEGEVIATHRHVENPDPKAPRGGGFVPRNGQKVHELALPSHLHDIRSAEELHRAVAELLKAPHPKRD